MTAPKSVPPRHPITAALLALALALAVACTPSEAPPTPQEAADFVADAEAKLLKSWIDRERAGWVQVNFITNDTELMAAAANERTIALTVDLANKA
jgi:peptidyl-dipeptidase A